MGAKRLDAGVVELVDAPDSKSGSARSVGSTPTTRTSTDLLLQKNRYGRAISSDTCSGLAFSVRVRASGVSPPQPASGRDCRSTPEG